MFAIFISRGIGTLAAAAFERALEAKVDAISFLDLSLEPPLDGPVLEAIRRLGKTGMFVFLE